MGEDRRGEDRMGKKRRGVTYVLVEFLEDPVARAADGGHYFDAGAL